jgi:hypothetical protein
MTERPKWVSEGSDKDSEQGQFRILYLGQIGVDP